jgi:hypothetical protein
MCSNEATDDFAMSLLKQEEELESEIESIEYIADHGLPIDVTSRIKRLRPFHPFIIYLNCVAGSKVSCTCKLESSEPRQEPMHR